MGAMAMKLIIEAIHTIAYPISGQLRRALSEGISSSIAESAVNQVVSSCMAKKQQMRRSDEGAHVLALVRVTDLNRDLSTQTFGVMTRPSRTVVDRSWNEFMALAA
jgi:hypothetical protein